MVCSPKKQTTLLYTICLLLGLAVINAKLLNPKKVVWAVDCGAKQARRSNSGFMYRADTGFKGGLFIDYSDNQDISSATFKYSNDQFIYMTERHAHESFQYEIPLTNPGRYVLILKLSENWHHEKGNRIFNVKLGSQRVLEGIDIVAKVGRFAELPEYIQFDFNNGQIFHDGRFCPNAWNPNTQKLTVEFEKTNVDNPKVDAFILFEGELADTDYYEIPKIREQWDKKAETEARKKEEEKIRKEEARLQQREKIKIRNDHLDDLDDDIEDIEEFESFENPLKSYLKNSPGILLIVVAGLIGLVGFSYVGLTSKGSSSSRSVPVASASAESDESKTVKKSKPAGTEKKKKT